MSNQLWKTIVLAFLFFTTTLILLGQNSTRSKNADTSIEIYSEHFCEIGSDTAKYKEGYSFETEQFYIFKERNLYYLRKTVEHRTYDSHMDWVFHYHTFKDIVLLNFPFMPLTQNLLIQVKNENIKPFSVTYIDSTKKEKTADMWGYHACIVKMILKLGRDSVEQSIIPSELDHFLTIGYPGGGDTVHTLVNQNYHSNQNLTTITLYEYILYLNNQFKEQKKFVIKD